MLLKLIKNKYLLAGAAFLVWMIFFDRNNWLVQQERDTELQQMREKLSYYELEINDTRKELKSLKHDPATVEQYAREKYLMSKPGEQVFIIADTLTGK